jgi:hypothetical protein
MNSFSKMTATKFRLLAAPRYDPLWNLTLLRKRDQIAK